MWKRANTSHGRGQNVFLNDLAAGETRGVTKPKQLVKLSKHDK